MTSASAPPGRSYLGTPATAPGPTGLQMLKELGAIRRDPLDYLVRVQREFGDVVQFPVPRPPTYLVASAEGTRHVLVQNARWYGKSTIQYRSLSLVTGEGLLSADTEPWRRQRRLVQPAFHHSTLDTLVDHVTAAADRVAADWNPGGIVDVDASMMRAAMEVVGRALFGTDLSASAQRLASATLNALDVVIARARVPITPPPWMPTPANLKLQRALRELDGAVAAMVAERDGSKEQPQDMLDLLIAARDDQGERLSVEEIRDQIVTFIVAGHETVASALTWAWALLGERSDVAERLEAEADALPANPTFADLSRLPYARAVYDEALRLYPPAWLITRKSLADQVVAGTPMPAGSLVILSPWLVHRDAAIWPDPEAFAPGRPIEEPGRCTYIPFGAGPRLCIGRDFAYVEGVLMLALLARRFRLEYPPGKHRPAAEPLVTVRPIDGLHMRVRKRP